MEAWFMYFLPNNYFMKWAIITLILIGFNVNINAQKIDYKVLRDSLMRLSCKPTDSLTIFQSNVELQRIDTLLIDKNIDVYYSDLGWSYYRMYMINNDTSLLRTSIKSYTSANRYKPNNSSTYWQLAFLHYKLGDCIQGKYYLNKFKNVTDKLYWREEQIMRMTKNCGE